eukprot:TRINITY_DN3105_c0_g2_i1.p1 TRINITY_DN3105_c0_g2~~TRINITY_DN3105_c0_g2_i1.p1  ORF type:complete len:373 (-),score=77.58 TRINITY_DN3105_c0_g2_i1:1005-2123(-)
MKLFTKIDDTENLFWDIYGFVVETPNENMERDAQLNFDLIKSLSVVWEHYLEEQLIKHDSTNIYLPFHHPTAYLRQLIRNGVPPQFRAGVWLRISGAYAKLQKNEGYYCHLLTRISSNPNLPCLEQIAKDLPRTFPLHRDIPRLHVTEKAKNILLAYSLKNPTIGYTQSLNFIVYIFLLVLKDEEQAFWLFSSMIENILPAGYYDETLTDVLIDQLVVKDLVISTLGVGFINHLEEVGLPIEGVVPNFLMGLFVTSVTSEIFFRIWDILLCDGIKILFRASVAIFVYLEEEILSCDDPEEMQLIFQDLKSRITNAGKFVDICFSIPLKRDYIIERRSFHVPSVNIQLQAVLRLRRQDPNRSVSPDTKEEREM